jgi:thioester reductase-like protein
MYEAHRPRTLGGANEDRGTKLNIETIAELWALALKLPLSAVSREHTFFDLGGHSLTLTLLATELSRSFQLSVPLSRLAADPTLDGHLYVLRSVSRDGPIEALVQANLPAVLRADCHLPDDIKPSGASICSLNDADTVLLTGATGFLGGVLLHDLLETTSARVICLVRFNNPTKNDRASGMARLRKNLLELGLWRDSLSDRIEVLSGNLSRSWLGLAPDEFEELAGRVQIIIHAAATVNLVYSYDALRSANVDGTQQILRLACQSGATVHYISSNGVFPPSNNEWTEDSMIEVEDVPNKLSNGYCQTKWVAEKLVHEAGRRGLPVRIYRVGTLSGHTNLGSTNTYDLMTALIIECLSVSSVPDIEGWRFEMIPVDYVSQGILAISNDLQVDQQVFHLGESNPIDAKSLFKSLSDLGYATQPLPWNEWVALWNKNRGSVRDGEFTIDILRGAMPTENSLKQIVVLEDKATRTVLKGFPQPKVNDKVLQTYALHWFARGYLPQAPTHRHRLDEHVTQKSRLYGKVAVITGASGGVGSALAVALSKEGVNLALAGRNLKALEDLKSKLVPSGVNILSLSTDVTDKAQVESLIQAANDDLGPVDIVVACAGVMFYTLIANARTDEWERTVEVNIKGVMHLLDSTIPAMLQRGSGHVVAISSDAGRKVFPGLGAYSASKFFVEAMLQSLRLETAGTGLRVTSIQPGNIATGLLGMSTDEEAIKKYGQPSGAKILNPDDVSSAIVYALKQPPHVAVNEVLIEPRDEPI